MEVIAPPRVLVADDQQDVLEALRLLLKSAGCEPDCVRSIPDLRARLDAQTYDLVLMDLNYARDTTSGREGLDLLAELHARDHLLPIIVMTGWGTIDTAVEAMRRGARTFVEKPWNNATLAHTIQRELSEATSQRRADALATRELQDARRVQRALLPAVLPAVAGFALAALWQPALATGGDCYDVVHIGGRRFGISIADVAGKGMAAALLMSNIQALVRTFTGDGSGPSDVAGRVNRALCGNTGLATMVTFFHAVVDGETGTITFCNAGHNPPILVRADGAVERLATGGLVLGIDGDATYDQQRVRLERGDRLLLFTDGLTEAERADGELFEDERLVGLATQHRKLSAHQLVDRVFADVHQFTGGSFRDDATAVVVAID
jgi:sigma-B regulation protein RsbU (phosphoserine phosphatase)